MRYLLRGLACYRLAKMITKESGPLDMFHHLRSYAGVYDLAADGRPQGVFGKLFECPYCVGVWVAAILMLLPKHKVTDMLVGWLAVAGLQAFLQELSAE